MAITRAQQVRQMLEDGGMLVQPSMTGKRPGYRGPGGYQGSDPDTGKGGASKGSSGGGGNKSGGGGNGGGGGNQNTGNAREDYITNYVSKSKVKGGGNKINLGGGPGDGGYEDATLTSTQINNAKKFKEEQKQKRDEAIKKSRKFNFTPFPIATAVLDKISNSKLAKYNNALQRNNYLRTLSPSQISDILEKIAEEEGIGTTNPMGIDRNIQRGLGEYDYIDEISLDKNNNIIETTSPDKGFLGTGIGAGKFVTDIEFGGKGAKDVINEVTDGGYDEYLNRNKTTTGGGGGDQEMDPCKGPNPPAYCFVNQDPTTPTTPTPTRNLGGLAPRFAGSIFDFTGLADGGRVAAMGGGLMNTEVMGGIADGNIDEAGRQMYFLGKLVKKATRAVKKVVKSPIGKAALMYGLGAMGGSFGAGKGFFSKGMFNPANIKAGLLGTKASMAAGPMKYLQGTPFTEGLLGKLGITKGGGSLMPTLKGGLALGLGVPFALDLLGVGKDDDDKMDLDEYYKSQGINIADIRMNPYNYLAPRFAGSRFAADGGLMRMGYQEGGDAEPVAKKTMPLIDMDGQEKDYRETGGFVDMGRMERADDVPARLSKNEFVFTADAVRNAGEGDIDKGAEVMYNMMKNLESGGDVSEESQGLDGAREMFQTSQRLEEVI